MENPDSPIEDQPTDPLDSLGGAPIDDLALSLLTAVEEAESLTCRIRQEYARLYDLANKTRKPVSELSAAHHRRAKLQIAICKAETIATLLRSI